jgi:heme/copper-type cytochrome/quinol oxidase subunit 2
MLTKHEKSFMEYWEQNKDSQKKFMKQLMIGLPVGSVFAIAIFLNFISGWNKKASMEFSANASLIPVLLIAAIIITVFISVFSVKYKWEMNEQKYMELKAKMKESDHKDSEIES